MWLSTLHMALREIARNLLRSALTTLGIVIGVASVIAMVTLGQSATARVRSDIAGLGENLLIVQPGADRRGPVGITATQFKIDDVRAIEKELPDVAGLAPIVTKGVLAVFGVGQVIESYWLTPKLVGDRIGLHPVAVIFAVLAGGQLFGFLGMLLALPVAAVANVLLHYAVERYRASRIYRGEQPVVIQVADAGSQEPPPA